MFCTYLKGGISSFDILGNAISARHDLDSRLGVMLDKSGVDYLTQAQHLCGGTTGWTVFVLAYSKSECLTH